MVLNDKPARGGIKALTDLSGVHGGTIARSDVAEFVVQQLTTDTWLRKAPLITWWYPLPIISRPLPIQPVNQAQVVQQRAGRDARPQRPEPSDNGKRHKMRSRAAELALMDRAFGCAVRSGHPFGPMAQDGPPPRHPFSPERDPKPSVPAPAWRRPAWTSSRHARSSWCVDRLHIWTPVADEPNT